MRSDSGANVRASSISVSLSLSLSLSRLWAELLKKKNSLLCTGLWCLPFNSPNPATYYEWASGGASHSGRVWGPENARGRKGPRANRCGERLASGVSRRARRLFGQFSLRAAVFAHPTDAAGAMVGFEGEITSIEASFDSPPENPRVKLNTRTPSRGGGVVAS